MDGIDKTSSLSTHVVIPRYLARLARTGYQHKLSRDVSGVCVGPDPAPSARSSVPSVKKLEAF